MSFNEVYRKEANLYFGQAPSATLKYLMELKLISDGDVLDLGCGEGRESLFLARRGFKAVAIDLSKYGISKLKKIKEKENLSIRCIVKDIMKYEYPSDTFDLVVGTTILDHIDVRKISRVVNGIKRTLKQGGYVSLTVFTTTDPGNKRKADLPASNCSEYVKHYFKPNELLTYFIDLHIVYYSDTIEFDDRHGKIHYHGVARLIAKKEKLYGVR